MSHMMPSPPPPHPQPYNPHRMEANGRYPDNPESPAFLIFMNALNALTHFLLGAVTICAFFYATLMRGSITIGTWTFAFPSAYSQHIFLCVTGYVVLMSQAMLAFNPHAGWASNLLYPQKKLVHIVMQIGGSLFAVIGSIIKIVDSGDAIFSSNHGIVGFVAMLLTLLSLVGGVLNFIVSQKNGGVMLFKVLHACLGGLTVTVAFIAMIVAYSEFVTDGTAGLAIAVTVLALLGLLTSVFINVYRRICK